MRLLNERGFASLKIQNSPAAAADNQICYELADARRLLLDLEAHALDRVGNQSRGTRDRKGQAAIRINQQYRLCFTWKDGDAYDVEITDYH